MCRQNREERITHLQSKIAITSFAVGTIIACICLFFIPPIGEIAETAMAVVSEFLILCGSLLGIKCSFDLKLRKFENRLLKGKDKEEETEA